MVDILRPADETEVCQLFREAAARRHSYDLVGSGSKQRIGRPPRATAALSTRNFRGVTLYEPSEFVISARGGTLLSVIEAELSKHNQQLAFEPVDVGPMLGGPAGQATIGGVVATNLSGSRRLSAGAARDHLLGIRAINGRGEAIKSGGRGTC